MEISYYTYIDYFEHSFVQKPTLTIIKYHIINFFPNFLNFLQTLLVGFLQKFFSKF
jgi:hypothetical protein